MPIDRISEPVPTAVPDGATFEAFRARNSLQEKLEQPGTPDGTEPEHLLRLFEEILADPGRQPIFATGFPLEHEEKLILAKMIIAKNLGTEKTILYLWGITRGGRNHHLYVEARKMLDRLMEDLCSK